MLKLPFLFVLIAFSNSLSAQTPAANSANAVPDPFKVYEITEVQVVPIFPGGDQALITYLDRNIKYPRAVNQKGIEGEAIISFVVASNGAIAYPEIIKDPGGGCGEEAFRVVNAMPAWTPGSINGVALNVRYILPVKFMAKDPAGINADEALDSDKVYDLFDVNVPPKFPGGDNALMEFVNENLVYPAFARQKKYQGMVAAKFVVNEDGKISDVKINRDLGGGTGDEVMRIIGLMPDWIPGYFHGKPVKVRYTLPVRFRLD